MMDVYTAVGRARWAEYVEISFGFFCLVLVDDR